MFKINNIISMELKPIEPDDKIEIKVDSQYKSVSKEEFKQFIDNYPTKLEMDVYAVCEPALITYNDFSLGKWPDSVVARTWLYEDNPEDHYYCAPENRKYYILK